MQEGVSEHRTLGLGPRQYYLFEKTMKIIQESFISKQTRVLLICPIRFDKWLQKCYNLVH